MATIVNRKKGETYDLCACGEPRGRTRRKCQPCRNIQHNEQALLRRLKAIRLLGDECACCREGTYEFLQIDHIDGGGGRERAAGTRKGALSVLRHPDPKSKFRVLCANCHAAKSFYGYCPHGGV